MEVSALALSVVDQLEKHVREEIDRCRKSSEYHTAVGELYETVKKLQRQRVMLTSKCKEVEPNLSSERDNASLLRGANTVDENLESLHDGLDMESGKSQRAGQVTDLTRSVTVARDNSEILNDCQNDAVAVEHDMKEHYEIALEAQQAEACEAKAQDVGAEDRFCASFDVEKNPDHVVLRYGPMPCAGEEHDVATVSFEAQLKRAVLGMSEADKVSTAVGCLGMGGVGKSCALRGLAADEDVRKRFPDGVYMVVLGEKASKVDVVKGVSDMVKHSGGRKLAEDMWKEGGDVREVMSQARAWFRCRRILLLVDDVWENSEVKGSIIRQLHGSVLRGQSRLVFTTRRPRLAAQYETIEFTKREKTASREILLKAAGARVGSTGSFKEVVDGVLKLCAGLPLALAIAGKIIAVRFRNLNEQRWREAWAETLTVMRSRWNQLVEGIDCFNNKHSLEAVCESSLETLEDGRRIRLGFEPEMSVHEMYRSLVVLKKQAAVPVGVLRRLWGMDDECDALKAMHMFVEASLVERRSMVLNGKDTACVSLHDLQHDFVQAKCKERGEEEQHHRRLLDGWWDGAGRSREVGEQARRDWSGSEAFEDEYMRNNLSRHLVGAGLGSKLRGLLRNPRWTAKRLQMRELLGLEEDFGAAMASVEVDDGAEEGRGSEERERWGLEMIVGAARLSAFYVGRSPREVWFQLRGRLVGVAEKSSVIREFVDKIDEYAERPWARPTWACLCEPGGRALSIAQCAGPVEDMRRGGREGEVRVCGVADGMGFMCSVVNGEVEGEEVFVNKRAEAGCACARVGKDEGFVRSGSDRSVCDGCSGSCADVSARVEWSAVRSVKYTADGSRVVTRHVNGTARMWDGASGKAMDGAFGGYGERCEWSPDGKRVVCGGSDGSVRIWDGVSSEAVGGDERAHSGWVSCVEWSPDGERVVSGGGDGSVRIWDGVSGKVVGGDECAHSDRVSCAEWAPDGGRVVTGGWDGSVRIWDGVSGEASGGEERAHSEPVWCVEWSLNSDRYVSGGRDGSVRIWDSVSGVSGEAVSGDKRAHGKVLRVVGWLPDGSQFKSSGPEGSVRIWHLASGEAVVTEHAACGPYPWKLRLKDNGKRIVRANSTQVWNPTRTSGEEDAAESWVADGRELKHWCVGRRVVLATFEADHKVTRCAEYRDTKGAVVLGFLDDKSMYRVEILK